MCALPLAAGDVAVLSMSEVKLSATITRIMPMTERPTDAGLAAYGRTAERTSGRRSTAAHHWKCPSAVSL